MSKMRVCQRCEKLDEWCMTVTLCGGEKRSVCSVKCGNILYEKSLETTLATVVEQRDRAVGDVVKLQKLNAKLYSYLSRINEVATEFNQDSLHT